MNNLQQAFYQAFQITIAFLIPQLSRFLKISDGFIFFIIVFIGIPTVMVSSGKLRVQFYRFIVSKYGRAVFASAMIDKAEVVVSLGILRIRLYQLSLFSKIFVVLIIC